MKKYIWIVILAAVSLAACSKNSTGSESGLDVDLNIPSAPRVVSIGQSITIYSYNGKNPLPTDFVLLKGFENPAISLEYPIDKVESNRFSFKIGSSFTTGIYKFCIKRGSQIAECGKVDWTLAGEMEPEDGATIYGKVSCGTNPVSGVPVSDGYQLVLTDDKGVYQLHSSKKNTMVFITVPSGYEVASKQNYSSQADGILPLFWHKTTKPSNTPERIDFTLYKVDGQDNHTAMFFGDMHLAGGKQNDLTQFSSFSSEIASYVSSHSADHIYGFTLGDMTWDLYWYDRKYCFNEYLSTMSRIVGMPIFHTIGNHDHNMKTSVAGASAGWDAVDWDTEVQFRSDLGPNYYSVNIGKIHYLVVDNIYCKNTTGGASSDRKYDTRVSNDCMNWVKKDLANVDKSTPVVVTMHSPVHNSKGGSALGNAADFKNLFTGFTNVTFISGHSHQLFTVFGSGTYSNICEYNSGAVCAAWWWAGYYYPGKNTAVDGAPAGYRVMDVKGTDMTSYFKGTGLDEKRQFRTYDRNCIDLSTVSLPDDAKPFVQSFSGKSTSNYVYINVWDYSKKWKVEVTENGKSLNVAQVNEYDPLYTNEYVMSRYGGKTGSVSFGTENTHHMFRAQASSATSTLVVSVTDDEGRVYTETMTRPKTFDNNCY